MFISCLFSMPALLNGILIIGIWLYESTQTMAGIKKAQAIQKARQEQKEKKSKKES